MYISRETFIKYLELLESGIVTVEQSKKEHLEPLTEKQLNFIRRHPKQMEKRFGFTNIKYL
jgi:hypothetical protein